MDITVSLNGVDSFDLTNVKEIYDCKEGREPIVLRGGDMRKVAIYPDHSYTIVSCNTVYAFSGAHLQLLELPAID